MLIKQKPPQNRIIWLDFLRAIAICCVIITHSCERVYTLNVQAISQYPMWREVFALLMFTVGRLGVPIFFFITGYLLLDREYNYNKTLLFYKKNLLGLLLTTEIWIIIYNIFNAWFYSRPIELTTIIKNMLFLKQTEMSHMWYMPVVIGIYLLVPFVSNALKNMDKRLFLIPMTIVSLYLYVLPELNVILAAEGKDALLSLPDFSFSGGVYGLCLIGGYLVKKNYFDKVNTFWLILIGIFCFIFTVGLQIFSYSRGVEYNVWYNNASLILTSFTIFIIVSRCKLKCSSLISGIGKYSFGIYLVHNPINMLLIKNMSIQSSVVKLMLVCIITLIISWFLVFILHHQKHVSKILFFIR